MDRILEAIAYIAGPYRADSEWGVLSNIRKAEQVALAVWGLGIPALCPHKNTMLFGGALPDTTWLDGDLVMLRRSDILVLVPGWENSSGTKAEVKLARALGIPIFCGWETSTQETDGPWLPGWSELVEWKKIADKDGVKEAGLWYETLGVAA